MTNIIDAVVTLVKGNHFKLAASTIGNNRANIQGDALEVYVKNLFADTFACTETDRLQRWSEVFSWLGNKNNPPDFMLRNGDAGEVKKIESPDAALALNSSYPKHTLKSSSPLISEACRNAEGWSEKDMIYIVGVVNGNRLKHLCMVYGLDYCASEKVYKSAALKLTDPLGITHAKFAACEIENPWRAFDYVHKRNFHAEFNFMCIINAEKWLTLDNRAKLAELQRNFPALRIVDVKLKNPDKPAELRDAKLITYDAESPQC